MTLRRLLPLAVTAIVAVTAVPVSMRPIPAPFRLMGDLSDVVANVLLYVPLGAALRGRHAGLVGGVAAAAAAVIEILQAWYIGRTPTVSDVVANTAGALGGLWLARRAPWPSPAVRVPRVVAVPLAVLALAIQIAWMLPRTSSAIGGWDAQFPLLVGNEPTGDRPWSGVIEEMAILPGYLPPDRVADVSRRPPGGIATGIASALTVDHPVAVTGHAIAVWPPDAAPLLVEQVQANQALSIVARLRPADARQEGPGRIVTFSNGPYQGNFMLGQERGSYVFRVRTAASGLNGLRPEAATRRAVHVTRSTVVAATYDGGVSRVYVDGVQAARANLAAAGCAARVACEWGLPWVGTGFGMLVTAAALLAIGPQHRRIHWMVAAGSAAIAVLLALVGDLRATAPDFWPFLPLVVAVGAAASAWSLGRSPDTRAAKDIHPRD